MKPVLIGILNAFIPGLGYLVIKERLVFGWLIFLAVVLFMIVMVIDPSVAFDSFTLATTPTGKLLESLSYLLGALAFGYDAYDLARSQRARTIQSEIQ